MCYIVNTNTAIAQPKVEEGYFRNPMNLPMNLSGNFGELRNNHFHSGLDLRTEQEEGKQVFSVADGYVSRIKVSGYGYGNALYITHPNGLVSVYAHLQSYCDSVNSYLKKKQYQAELFELDLMLSPSVLPVKKGQLIGLSGNSGGSEAPHLHFEIRDEKTEWALNPLLYGFSIDDTLKPILSEIIIYPINDASHINNKTAPLKVAVKKNSAGNYFIDKNDIVVHGIIGFGIQGFDTENGSWNKNGLYSYELKINGENVFYSGIEKFAFDQTKQINAHIDFPRKKLQGEMFQRCFVLPGNTLPFYKTSKTRGVYSFSNDSVYEVAIVVGDVYGNTSQLNFYLKSTSEVFIPEVNLEQKKFSDFFYYNVKNTFKNNEIQLEIPKGCLYEDVEFIYTKKDSLKNFLSPIYQIHYDYVPLSKPISLFIKLNNIPPKLKSKVEIVSIGGGGRINSEGGEWDEKNSGISTTIKSFGRYAVMVDTIRPTISLLAKTPNKTMLLVGKSISFKVWDNLSGIKKIIPTVDGKWVLYSYDGKNNKITIVPDERFPQDEKLHDFVLEVIDQKGNTRSFKSKIKFVNVNKNNPTDLIEIIEPLEGDSVIVVPEK
jgi:hypothetical protein